jgi:ADP-ribose pyrophosphatase
MSASRPPSRPPEEQLLEAQRFRVVRLYEQCGKGLAPRAREVIRHPGSVVLIPLFDDGRVCLIKNFRIAVGQTLIELPAGTREPDENPWETARRELLEETGLRCEHLEELASFYAAPGILDEKMHLYLATGLFQEAAHREPGEQIENLVVSLDQAWEMVQSGQICDAKTLVGLLHLRCLLRP